jgi:hypothetical protein
MPTNPEELLAALDDAEIVGTATDAMGDWAKVGVLGSAVLIGVNGSPAIFDTPEMRDNFAKLYADACRRAEAAEAGAAARGRAPVAADDKLVERIGRIGDRVSHVVALASPSPDLLRANEGAYAALGTLLSVHALTAFTRYTQACPAHLMYRNGYDGCPDCITVERNGCDRCRDENGRPAKPEDCEPRTIIAQCLTRTIDEASIDALTTGKEK